MADFASIEDFINFIPSSNLHQQQEKQYNQYNNNTTIMTGIPSSNNKVEETISVFEDVGTCLHPDHYHSFQATNSFLTFPTVTKTCISCQEKIYFSDSFVKCVACGVLAHRSCMAKTKNWNDTNKCTVNEKRIIETTTSSVNNNNNNNNNASSTSSDSININNNITIQSTSSLEDINTSPIITEEIPALEPEEDDEEELVTANNNNNINQITESSLQIKDNDNNSNNKIDHDQEVTKDEEAVESESESIKSTVSAKSAKATTTSFVSWMKDIKSFDTAYNLLSPAKSDENNNGLLEEQQTSNSKSPSSIRNAFAMLGPSIPAVPQQPSSEEGNTANTSQNTSPKIQSSLASMIPFSMGQRSIPNTKEDGDCDDDELNEESERSTGNFFSIGQRVWKSQNSNDNIIEVNNDKDEAEARSSNSLETSDEDDSAEDDKDDNTSYTTTLQPSIFGRPFSLVQRSSVAPASTTTRDDDNNNNKSDDGKEEEKFTNSEEVEKDKETNNKKEKQTEEEQEEAIATNVQQSFPNVAKALQENILASFGKNRQTQKTVIAPTTTNSRRVVSAYPGQRVQQQSDSSNNDSGKQDNSNSKSAAGSVPGEESSSTGTSSDQVKRKEASLEAECLAESSTQRPTIASRFEQVKGKVNVAAVAGGIAGGVAGLALAGPAGAYAGYVAAGSFLIEGAAAVGVVAAGVATGGLTGQQIQGKIDERGRVLTLGEEEASKKVLLIRPNIHIDPVWDQIYLEARRSARNVYRKRQQCDSDIIKTDDNEIKIEDKILLLVSRTLNDKTSVAGHVFRFLIQAFEERCHLRKRLSESSSSIKALSPRARRDDAHAIIKHVTAALMEDRPEFGATPGLTEITANAVEGIVFGQLYDSVYEEIVDESFARDVDLWRKISQFEQEHDDFIKQSLVHGLISEEAVQALKMLPQAKTTVDKLYFCGRFLDLISDHFSNTNGARSICADSLLKMVCQHIILSENSQSCHAQIAFLEEYARDEQLLRGRDGYSLVTLQAALHYLINVTDFRNEVFEDTTNNLTNTANEEDTV